MKNIEEVDVYNQTNDMFDDDISTEEIPDFVQKYADKCDKEEAEAKMFAVKCGFGLIALVVAIFYICWKIYA